MEQAPLHDQLAVASRNFYDTFWMGSTGAGGIRAVIDGVGVETYWCPSSPLPRFRTDGPSDSTAECPMTDYVLVAGSSNHPTTDTSAESASHFSDGGVFRNFANCSFRDITDGSSNTFCIAEQSGFTIDGTNRNFDGRSQSASGWVMGSKNNSRPTGTPESWPEDDRCWNTTTVRQGIGTKIIGGGWAKNPACNTPIQSAHPGGTLVVVADASVRFLTETTDLGVVMNLADRDDGNPVQFP